MPTPIEICLEDLTLSPEDERFVRCVALPGGQPGLALDREGLVRWMPEEPADYGLWVSADDRLVLLRGEEAGPIAVHRAGRSLEAPPAKPVILVDGDELKVNGRTLRVHVHGVAEEVYAPEPFSLARLARSAAAGLALGAMVGAGGVASAGEPEVNGLRGPAPIEVRARPPIVARPQRRVLCKIDSMEEVKRGNLRIRATCPKKVAVGTWGQLLDAKGKALKKGRVVVKKAKGKTVEAEAASLKSKVKSKSVQFWVY